MELKEETTLAKVKLHWGVFVPVLLLTLILIAATLPAIFFVNAMGNTMSQMARQFNQPPAGPSFNLIWLVVGFPELVVVLGLFLVTWVSYSRSEVTLTSRRLVYRTGFLSKRSGELPLENVESIFISEPLLGRVCGYGTVMVSSVGGAHFPFAFIGSPQSFHYTLQKAVTDAKDCVKPVSKPPCEPLGPRKDDSRYMPKG